MTDASDTPTADEPATTEHPASGERSVSGAPDAGRQDRPRSTPPRRLRSLMIGSIIAVALAVVLFVGLGHRSGSGAGSSGPVVGIGDPAPSFSLPSLTGGSPVVLDALGKDRHHPVVLNFVASWCVPCQEETPLLARTADTEQAKGSNVQFIGVDTLDPRSSALPFVEKSGITYPVGSDGGQVSSGLYAIDGDPQSFFLDAEGTWSGTCGARSPWASSSSGYTASAGLRPEPKRQRPATARPRRDRP